MRVLGKQLDRSPAWARVAPFFIFAALTALQGRLGPGSAYWVYLAKTLIGAWLIWEMQPLVPEMRWNLSWEACVMGVVVCLLWIGLDGLYPRLMHLDPGWNPHRQFGQGTALAWLFVVVRLAGSSLVVPPLEEVFYRSFLYRFLIRSDFLAVPFRQFHLGSFLITSAMFGLAHPDRWLAGILCGMGYQWVVLRKNRLGDAILAHALTNFLLGLWVICKGAWNFW